MLRGHVNEAKLPFQCHSFLTGYLFLPFSSTRALFTLCHFAAFILFHLVDPDLASMLAHTVITSMFVQMNLILLNVHRQEKQVVLVMLYKKALSFALSVLSLLHTDLPLYEPDEEASHICGVRSRRLGAQCF